MMDESPPVQAGLDLLPDRLQNVWLAEVTALLRLPLDLEETISEAWIAANAYLISAPPDVRGHAWLAFIERLRLGAT